MNDDEKEKETNLMRQRVDDDAWDKTIISIEHYNLRELSLPIEEDVSMKGDLFRIRLALTDQRRTQVNLLIKNKFSWPEYSTTNVNFNEKQNRIILMVDRNDILIGTITLCFDTPLGLDVDETYKTEVDHLRRNGRKLAEVTNFATEGASNNKNIMAAIVHIAYIYARIHGCTDFVIEVKARHAPYYEKKLNFKRCGPEKLCSWTNESAVLLCLDIGHMGRQIEKLGGHPPPPGEKSLYPYFFAQQDEIGITNRLIRGG